MQFGLYRSKRLNNGTNSSAEIFQHTLKQTLQGLGGVRNLADHILEFGKTYEAHNMALKACLQRLQERNLNLDVNKCRYLRQNLDIRLTFYSRGYTTRSKKVSAFVDHKRSSTTNEVGSYLVWPITVGS